MDIEYVLSRDAIPSVDDPSFGREHFGEPNDEVVVVDGDPPSVYPIHILRNHGTVNDAVDGMSPHEDFSSAAASVRYEHRPRH